MNEKNETTSAESIDAQTSTEATSTVQEVALVENQDSNDEKTVGASAESSQGTEPVPEKGRRGRKKTVNAEVNLPSFILPVDSIGVIEMIGEVFPDEVEFEKYSKSLNLLRRAAVSWIVLEIKTLAEVDRAAALAKADEIEGPLYQYLLEFDAKENISRAKLAENLRQREVLSRITKGKTQWNRVVRALYKEKHGVDFVAAEPKKRTPKAA